MPSKTDKGAALSSENAATTTEGLQGKDASALMQAIDKSEPPDLAPDEPQDSGQLALSLSQATLDAMSAELREALSQIASGFGELTAPGTIYATGEQFYVIDAFTIDDYLDQTTGEEKKKHVFRLEFADGIVKNVMQSDARPRRVLARAFVLARGLGGGLKIGPYKFEAKKIAKQIAPAYIFSPQPGFEQKAYR